MVLHLVSEEPIELSNNEHRTQRSLSLYLPVLYAGGCVAAGCGLRAAAHATRLFPLGRVLIAPNLKSANFENLIFIRAVRTVQLLMH